MSTRTARKGKGDEWVSGAELARRMGVSRQRIDILRRKGSLKRRDRDKRYHYPTCRAVMEDGRQKDPNNLTLPEGDFESLTEARKAVETFKARQAELDYRERLGELVELAQVTEFCQKVIATARSKILSVPAKVAPELVGQTSIKRIKAAIEAELHHALAELSKMDDVNGATRKRAG